MRTATKLEFSCIRYLLANMSVFQLTYSIIKYLFFRHKYSAVNDDSYVELLKATAKFELARQEMTEKNINNLQDSLDKGLS